MGVGLNRSLLLLPVIPVSIPSSSGMGVGPLGYAYGSGTTVSIPSSSGMGVGLRDIAVSLGIGLVSIPSSSGMGVGRAEPPGLRCSIGLNTFFIRYGCRTLQAYLPAPIFRSQYLLHQVWVSDKAWIIYRPCNSVSIPSSSGMGVGHYTFADRSRIPSLNTFFIRYGCRTLVKA